MSRKKYTPEVKAKAVLKGLKERKTANEIAKPFAVHPTMLSTWKKLLVDQLPAFFADPSSRRSAAPPDTTSRRAGPLADDTYG